MVVEKKICYYFSNKQESGGKKKQRIFKYKLVSGGDRQRVSYEKARCVFDNDAIYTIWFIASPRVSVDIPLQSHIKVRSIF